jgi:hypothetical protein
MTRNYFIVLSTLLNLAFSVPSAFSAQVEFVEIKVSSGKIAGLEWDREFSKIESVFSGNANQIKLKLFGAYRRNGWNLQFHHQNLPTSGNGVFSLVLPLEYGKNHFVFEAYGPNGERENETITIAGSDGPSRLNANRPNRWYFFPGLAISSVSTKQTEFGNYNTLALTPKLSLNYRLKPGVFDLGLSAFSTTYQFSKTTSAKANYIGLNARLGYLLPAFDSNWFLSIYGGWYYTTMVVSNRSFGYVDISGPQIYPTVRYVMENGDAISAYLKFSPVSEKLSLMNISNREIAGGLGYIWILENGQSFSLNLDVSNIILSRESKTVENDSVSIGVQYGI